MVVSSTRWLKLPLILRFREGDELIGIYADNNHTGDGVGRAIKQAGLQDSVIVVAFDDGPLQYGLRWLRIRCQSSDGRRNPRIH